MPFFTVANRGPFFNEPSFHDTWDDYSLIRPRLSNIARSLWDESPTETFPTFPLISWMSPHHHSDLRDDFHALNLFRDRTDKQLIRHIDNDSKFEVCLDSHLYKSEEIKVSVDDVTRVLTVSGQHEDKVEEEDKEGSGSCKRSEYRKFERSYTLPKECDLKAISSNRSQDGVLIVSCPKLAIEDESEKK